MASNTTSLKFPNMFNIAQNQVAVLEDRSSVVNRCRLLILTEPTELYNSPDFGVGLRRHMYKYNTENEKALIVDRTKKQLKLHEPYCISEETDWADGLLFTGSKDDDHKLKPDELDMTIAVVTTFSDKITITIGANDIVLE